MRRCVLLLDNDVLVYLFNLFRTIGREDSRKVLTDLVRFTGARWVWIPRTVHAEFLNVSRRYHRRKTFLQFLGKTLLDRGLDFRICPLYDHNRINGIMHAYGIDVGEADALNQMLALERFPEVERRYLYYRAGYCFITNDRGVLEIELQRERIRLLPYEEFARWIWENRGMRMPGL